MAYVALVGGAVVSGSTFMADVVWALTFTTFCYAVVTAFFGKGIRRAIQRESEIARNYRSGKTATAHRDLLTTITKWSRILTNYSRKTEQGESGCCGSWAFWGSARDRALR